jgi:hypothetical protein
VVRSIILHKGDIRSHVSDREPASSPDGLCWLGSLMSPFYVEGDLTEHAWVILTKRAQHALFSGRTGCSQVGCRSSQVRVIRHSHHACAETDAVPR